MNIALLLCVAFFEPTFDVTDYGAVADGRVDCAPAIQAAIDAAEDAGGGTVLIPSSETVYLIRDGVTISGDAITLDGSGATIRMADGAIAGEIVDCIEVVGTEDDKAEDVVIRGLTIDANFWAQPGSYNPRGIDSDHATRLLVEKVRIERAFVGLTFGLGVTDSEARDCVITTWFDDAFNASGDGVSGGVRGFGLCGAWRWIARMKAMVGCRGIGTMLGRSKTGRKMLLWNLAWCVIVVATGLRFGIMDLIARCGRAGLCLSGVLLGM